MPDNGFSVTINIHYREQTSAKPFGLKAFLDNFERRLLLADNQESSPRPIASATMFTIVWLLPVPGGPSTRRPGDMLAR